MAVNKPRKDKDFSCFLSESNDNQLDVFSKNGCFEQMNIVLLGKTGHGKSSTGNSLLFELCEKEKRDIFKKTNNSTSQTSNVTSYEYFVTDDLLFKVFDTPGLRDTEKTEMMDVNAMLKNFDSIMKTVASDGITCFLLILNYSSHRFTSEEINVLKTLQQIFSDRAMLERVIVAFTHKDNFDADQEPEYGREPIEKQEWDEWVKSQTGSLKEILEVCGYKCLPFNNKPKYDRNSKLLEVSKAQLMQQRNALIEMIREENMTSTSYTLNDYESFFKSREELLKITFFQAIEKEVKEKLKTLNEEVDKVENKALNTTRNIKELGLKGIKEDECRELYRSLMSCREKAYKISSYLTKYDKTPEDKNPKLNDVRAVKQRLDYMVSLLMSEVSPSVTEQDIKGHLLRALGYSFGISVLATATLMTGGVCLVGASAALAAGSTGAAASVAALGATTTAGGMFSAKTVFEKGLKNKEELENDIKSFIEMKGMKDELLVIQENVEWEGNLADFKRVIQFSKGDYVMMNKYQNKKPVDVRGVKAGCIGTIVGVEKTPGAPCKLIVDFPDNPSFEAYPDELSIWKKKMRAVAWKKDDFVAK